ncbi:SMP-30/gluconolactonase/LRE family protein [Planomonospora sp. ID67723]|uniref:SMP-30/gluconolactonase/LRE family protein n=1 Tax=Planomonospora sp. ID67723 TaxID=2738134 RepID=UPI0018C39DC1|nr:SMP-30/gluconolactonase/LRE family protein [Planomonospora sp. ID67723]MBG0830212.1 SMP-30/gluconolactonase/LRE family protein [Planomonospora sp. ID67723]
MPSISARRRLKTILTAAALASVLAPAPAASAATPDVIEGRAPSLHPEGVAYDPTRGAYLVSSLRHGTVSVVRPDGSVRTLVDDPALISAIGIQVDAARRRLLVANADPGMGVRTSPGTQGRLAGLGIYDLASGRRTGYVDLAEVAGDSARHFANDLAVAPDGTVYVTDSFAPIVYRVPTRGEASVLLRDRRLSGGDGFGANGIAWRDGHLLIGKYDDGTLWRVPVRRPGALRQVRLDRALPGADGIVLRRDGSLVVVTNKVAASGTDAVFTVRPSAGWSRATVTGERAWPDQAPTTAAVRPDGSVHVLSGRLDLLFAGITTDTFTLRKH